MVMTGRPVLRGAAAATADAPPGRRRSGEPRARERQGIDQPAAGVRGSVAWGSDVAGAGERRDRRWGGAVGGVSAGA